MKKTVLAASLAVLCSWTATASDTILAQANFTQPLNIDLTASIAGPTSTIDGIAIPSAKHIHITTVDVIAALSVSLGVSFPTNAQLLLTESTSGALTVAVKEGTNAAVDVTEFFVFVSSSNYIESASSTPNVGSMATKVEVLETFGLQDGSSATTLPWHFRVLGVATIIYSGIDSGGTVTEENFAMRARVSGSGDYAGAFALFQGRIEAGAGPGPGGPGEPGEFGGNALRSPPSLAGVGLPAAVADR